MATLSALTPQSRRRHKPTPNGWCASVATNECSLIDVPSVPISNTGVLTWCVPHVLIFNQPGSVVNCGNSPDRVL